MTNDDPKVETTESADTAEQKRLTVEVPTDVQAGLKPAPTCTCPPGCCGPACAVAGDCNW